MKNYLRGFTLIEMLVVVGMITLLASIVLFSVSEARANARDKARISDLKQYELAFRLYVERYGTLPACADGFRLDSVNQSAVNHNESFPDCSNTEKTQTIAFLQEYFGSLPTDPLGPGNENYYYYYDSTHNDCPNAWESGLAINNPMIFAVSMEGDGAANAIDVCPNSEALNDTDGGFSAASYVIHLGQFR